MNPMICQRYGKSRKKTYNAASASPNPAASRVTPRRTTGTSTARTTSCVTSTESTKAIGNVVSDCWNTFAAIAASGKVTGGIATLLSSEPLLTTLISASPVAFMKNVTTTRPTNAEST